MTKFDATQLLRNDHKTLHALFLQIKTTQLRAPEMKAGVLNELLMFLEIHSTLEEELFYPELQKFSDAAALIEKSFEDHTAVENWIQKIRSAPETAAAGIALIEMREAVELHFATEEKELFPLAERLLGAKLVELATGMQERKIQLLSQAQYAGLKPKSIQNPKGGEQSRRKSA